MGALPELTRRAHSASHCIAGGAVLGSLHMRRHESAKIKETSRRLMMPSNWQNHKTNLDRIAGHTFKYTSYSYRNHDVSSESDQIRAWRFLQQVQQQVQQVDHPGLF